MNKTQLTINDFLTDCKARVETALQQWLPSQSQNPDRLHQAIHYAIFNGGKRLRPALVYATAQCFNADDDCVDIPAMAVELIHCYSLVHDDLPAMDDDDLRRGKPTCHKQFDEPTAILVGDALQALAFELLACERESPSRALQLQMLKTLANASGSTGMVGGQALDLSAENQSITATQLETIHRLKTGALIRAAVKLGALAAGCQNNHTLHALDCYAANIGLAFQIQDDILDVESSTETLGKTAGADLQQNKATYPKLLGLEQSKQHQQNLLNQAVDALQSIPEKTVHLSQIALNLGKRNH